MTKIYRKTATIQAEQFDGSAEMIVKYGIEKERSVYPDGGFNYFVPPTRNKRVSTLDWIIIDANGAVSVLDDDDFKQQYAELPVIPKYVAECIINGHAVNDLVPIGGEIYRSMIQAVVYGYKEGDIGDWIVNHSDLFARA